MKSNNSVVIPVVLLVGFLAGACALVGEAAPLASAMVTETKNEVLYKPAGGAERAAKVNDVVQGADVLRTGERSLAEIEFSDKTITRLGSKSVFTFSAGTREFHPGNGTTLIYVPKGLGGGRIVTTAITAAIEGTTVIVEETERPPAPGQTAPRLLCKMIFLEGTGNVTLTHQRAVCPVSNRRIGAGQMIAQFADEPCLAPIQDIDLDLLVKRSAIVTGFSAPLPSMSLIGAQVTVQNNEKTAGTLVSPVPTVGVYSLNPSTGTQGISDPPMNVPSSAQGSLIPVGNGFFYSTRPLPGSEPIEGGGGYVWRP
jgi:hypothetical protein